MKIKKKTALTEATLADTIDQVEKEVDNAVVVDSDDEFELERTLTRALTVNKRLKQKSGRPQYVNILIEGEAGTGKTSRVIQWAKKHGVNLMIVRAAGMDDTDLGGAIAPNADHTIVNRLASTEFDKLDRPNSVLFLDEFNRAPKSVRTNLLQLVNDHRVPDPRAEDNDRELKNFLFTIASVNPATIGYDTDNFDRAELNRFKRIGLEASNREVKAYLMKKIAKDIEEVKASENPDEEELKELLGKQQLVDVLLDSKEFTFDNVKDIEDSENSGNGLILSPRSFEALLNDCNGTKDDFIAQYPYWCNSLKLPTIKNILADYKDVDDKATQALAGHNTESNVFGNRKAKIKDFMAGLDD